MVDLEMECVQLRFDLDHLDGIDELLGDQIIHFLLFFQYGLDIFVVVLKLFFPLLSILISFPLS